MAKIVTHLTKASFKLQLRGLKTTELRVTLDYKQSCV